LHQQPTAAKRHDDAQDGDDCRALADTKNGGGLRLQPDRKEQKDDADFGERVRYLGRRGDVEQAWSDDDSGEYLADDRRLLESRE